MQCVVCMDASASGVKGAYTCQSGCRGRDAVCGGCDARLLKCVFCRSEIVREEADVPEGGHIVAAFAGLLYLLIFLSSLAFLKDAPRSQDGSGEDAFGVPLPLNLDALD